jgi:hypothetical protein
MASINLTDGCLQVLVPDTICGWNKMLNLYKSSCWVSIYFFVMWIFVKGLLSHHPCQPSYITPQKTQTERCHGFHNLGCVSQLEGTLWGQWLWILSYCDCTYSKCTQLGGRVDSWLTLKVRGGGRSFPGSPWLQVSLSLVSTNQAPSSNLSLWF